MYRRREGRALSQDLTRGEQISSPGAHLRYARGGARKAHGLRRAATRSRRGQACSKGNISMDKIAEDRAVELLAEAAASGVRLGTFPARQPPAKPRRSARHPGPRGRQARQDGRGLESRDDRRGRRDLWRDLQRRLFRERRGGFEGALSLDGDRRRSRLPFHRRSAQGRRAFAGRPRKSAVAVSRDRDRRQPLPRLRRHALDRAPCATACRTAAS